jgi:2Fe-2S ferredoxin
MKIKLAHNDQIIEVSGDASLMTELKTHGFNIKTTCGGCASCADCVVKVIAGAENINEPTFEEKQLLGNVFHITKERLSCQTKIKGDITVDISNHLEEKVKAKSGVKLKKKDELNKVENKVEEKTEPTWFKHWEKESETKKKLGGGKRPKAFKYSNNENDN